MCIRTGGRRGAVLIVPGFGDQRASKQAQVLAVHIFERRVDLLALGEIAQRRAGLGIGEYLIEEMVGEFGGGLSRVRHGLPPRVVWPRVSRGLAVTELLGQTAVTRTISRRAIGE